MLNDKQCQGCGVPTQTTHPDQAGYVVRLDQTYCQRCFRLKHYGETKVIEKDAVKSEEVFADIRTIEGLIVLVSDITDLESGLFSSVTRHLPQRDMILVLTKTDLLPITVSSQKIERALMNKLKRENLYFKEVFMVGNHGKSGREELISALKKSPYQHYIFMGYANTGKSTLVNALLERNHATISPYPNTTLAIQRIQSDFGEVIDTPGIQIGEGIFKHIPFDRYDDYLWRKPIHVTHIQLKGEQALILPYVGIVIVSVSAPASISYYIANPKLIHRTNLANLAKYRQNHDIGLEKTQKHSLKPLDDGFDVVFKQIGWYSFRGKIDRLEVETHAIKDVILRKALI